MSEGTTSDNANMAVAFCIEGPRYEEAALTLAVSLRERAQFAETTPIYAVCPRPAHRPKPDSIATLKALGVTYLEGDFNVHWADYGLANKFFAGAEVERLVTGARDTLLLLDNDTLALRPLTHLALKGGEVCAAKPVGCRSVGLLAGQQPDPYWKTLRDACGVTDPFGYSVLATAGSQPLEPYFNSGVVAVRIKAGIYQKAAVLMNGEKSLRHIYDNGSTAERYHLEQALLSTLIAQAAGTTGIRILEHVDNFQLWLFSKLPVRERTGWEFRARLVHYHQCFPAAQMAYEKTRPLVS